MAMCVIFWTVNDPQYELVIASNRDEFLSRPTRAAEWHSFDSRSASPRVLSARDSTGGGTWLGVSENGAFAALTNFTESAPRIPVGVDGFKSRGGLVRDWLTLQAAMCGDKRSLQEVSTQVQEYLNSVGAKGDRYPGFNLLVGALSLQGMVVGYVTNRTLQGQVVRDATVDMFLPLPHGATEASSATSPPVGMSNSILAQPWRKVTSGSHSFCQIVSSHHTQSTTLEDMTEQLFDLLWTSSNPPPSQRSELQNSVLISPLELPASASTERDWYATRTSTVITIAKDGSARLVERDTFQLRDAQPVLVNGPEGTAALAGRDGGQRMFAWHIQ